MVVQMAGPSAAEKQNPRVSWEWHSEVDNRENEICLHALDDSRRWDEREQEVVDEKKRIA